MRFSCIHQLADHTGLSCSTIYRDVRDGHLEACVLYCEDICSFIGSEREFDGGPFYAAFLTC